MSLLGIDVGTTGCKAAVFSIDGRQIGFAYQEYDIQRPEAGWAELDAPAVWEKVQQVIRQAVSTAARDPVQAISVSSMGEAVVPVSCDRQILGPSLLNFDSRGEEYLPGLRIKVTDERLYTINGNTLGNHYSLTKLLWLREHRPQLWRQADLLLHWGSFVPFMLGAQACIDYSLANRTLLFDLDRQRWSEELAAVAGIEIEKLPTPVPSGQVIGQVSRQAAEALGLPEGTAIVSGAHDQCANAVGCGVIRDGQAVYGLGTFACITPVFSRRLDPALSIARGLNTEHHAVPGEYASFIYNQTGSIVKWFRDTFAAIEHRQARLAGQEVYDALLAEMPQAPSPVLVLPHFTVTGPPRFLADSCGVIVGLKLETRRGDILKGILEGTAFYLKECVDSLPEAGVQIEEYRAAGGGSKSDAWIQVCADIFGRPFSRPATTEAGTLGAAMIAGIGRGVFPSYAEAVQAMVRLERHYEPDMRQYARYLPRYELYKQMAVLMGDYLRQAARPA